MDGGRREGGRVGGMKRGKEVKKKGRRDGYLYPLVRSTLDCASAGCDLYTTT